MIYKNGEGCFHATKKVAVYAIIDLVKPQTTVEVYFLLRRY